MNRRRTLRLLAAPSMVVGTSGLACSSQPSADIPRIEEKTFTVTPATVPVQVGILTGRLTGLTVIRA